MAEGIEKGRPRSSSMEDPPAVSDLRLVLVGKTGTGKSSTGNTVLGREAFRAEASHSSVTAECCKQQGKVFSRMVSVVDTPGLFDTSQTEETVKREISKCINMSAPGPHAILLVLKIGSFATEEVEAAMKVTEIFGKEAWKNTIVLFTHGDEVESGFDEMLEEAPPQLKGVLEKAGDRYHVFNNIKANNRRQVLELMEKVQKMVDANGGKFYSNDDYTQAVKMLDQRERELKTFYEKKLEEEIKSVKSEYEKLLSEAREEKQQMEERLESELKELKRYYHALESGVRQVVEQAPRDEEFNQLLKRFHETLTLN